MTQNSFGFISSKLQNTNVQLSLTKIYEKVFLFCKRCNLQLHSDTEIYFSGDYIGNNVCTYFETTFYKLISTQTPVFISVQ